LLTLQYSDYWWSFSWQETIQMVYSSLKWPQQPVITKAQQSLWKSALEDTLYPPVLAWSIPWPMNWVTNPDMVEFLEPSHSTNCHVQVWFSR
jgi:hypothetical protein